MRPATLAVLLMQALATAHGATLVPRRCFRDGPEWEGSQRRAADAVNRLCHGGAGGMSGSFTRGQTKTGCFDIRDGVTADFHITWVGDKYGYEASKILDDDECRKRLNNEIWGCESGGESQFFEWYYSADPQKGFC